MALKINSDGQYRKPKDGGGFRPVFRYKVVGSEKEIQEYKDHQGDNLRMDDDGVPFFFSTTYVGKTGTLIKSMNSGNYSVDNSKEDQMTSLVNRYEGTALGAALANKAAEKLLADLGLGSAPVAVQTPANQGVVAASPDLNE